MVAHVLPKRIYFLVFACLIALTVTTTAVAFINLGPLNTVAALVIAVLKALLVILFFMHARYSAQMTRIVIVAAFFWLAILLTLTLSDELTRRWIPSSGSWQVSTVVSRPSHH